MERYTAEDVDRELAENGIDASELLNIYHPKAASRFRRSCKDLQALLVEVKRTFPQAELFVEGESGLHLLLGPIHDENNRHAERATKKSRSAENSFDLEITGGAI